MDTKLGFIVMVDDRTYADLVQGYLDEFMFRERFGKAPGDMFQSTIRTIAQQWPCP